MAKDYYSVLGISRDADEKAVKNAYRKLAREYHPDVNPNNPSAEAKFKEISNAFQVLSDPDKRKLYDQFGENYDKIPPGYSQYGPQGGSGSGGANPYGAGGFPGGGFPGGASGYAGGVNLEDLLKEAARGAGGGTGPRVDYRNPGAESDFGGGDMGGLFGQFLGRHKRGPQKGPDVEQPLEISFKEAIRGTQRSFNLSIRSDNGRDERREVTVKIPALVDDGAKVKVAGKGASSSNGGANGDLFLNIQVRPDPFWKRDGQNIRIEVPVSFAEAAQGATIPVPTLGGSVNLKIPAGTQSGQTFALRGHGIHNPKTGTKGDEFVTVKVAVPKHLTPREEELVRELAALRTDNPRQGLPQGLD